MSAIWSVHYKGLHCVYKSRSGKYITHIYKSDRYLAKSVPYVYIRGGYTCTNIAFVGILAHLNLILILPYGFEICQVPVTCPLHLWGLQALGKAFIYVWFHVTRVAFAYHEQV